MRRFKFFCLAFYFFRVSAALAFELPDKIQNWQAVKDSFYAVSLIPDANSKDLGKIIYKNYQHETPRGYLEIILTSGDGTGSLYVPESVKESKGVMPSDSSYEILNVLDKKALLENNPYLPLVLAVAVKDNVILNLESPSLNKDELVKIAEEILSLWNSTKSDSSPAP